MSMWPANIQHKIFWKRIHPWRNGSICNFVSIQFFKLKSFIDDLVFILRKNCLDTSNSCYLFMYNLFLFVSVNIKNLITDSRHIFRDLYIFVWMRQLEKRTYTISCQLFCFYAAKINHAILYRNTWWQPVLNTAIIFECDEYF